MLTKALITAALLAVAAAGAFADGPAATEAFVRCCYGTYNEELAQLGALVTVSVNGSADVDSVAILCIDSLSIPGQPVQTYVGYGTLGEPGYDPYRPRYHEARWQISNLLGGSYYLYAVTYRLGVEVGSSQLCRVELRHREHDTVLIN